jgi:hypothetical protein
MLPTLVALVLKLVGEVDSLKHHITTVEDEMQRLLDLQNVTWTPTTTQLVCTCY